MKNLPESIWEPFRKFAVTDVIFPERRMRMAKYRVYVLAELTGSTVVEATSKEEARAQLELADENSELPEIIWMDPKDLDLIPVTITEVEEMEIDEEVEG